MLKKIALLAICMSALLPGAFAQDKSAAIKVERAHARIVPSNGMGAIYLTIVNSGKEPDRLVAVSTPLAGKAELHTVTEEGGVMKMRSVDGIDVKPGETIELKPGGLHIMLMGVKGSPKPGDTFPLTLTFEKAGVKSVTTSVDNPSG